MSAVSFPDRKVNPVKRPAMYLIPLVTSPRLPIDISSRFGVRLRELRQEKQLTQLRMAVNFGIDRSYISDVERGCKAVSLPMLEVIALGFNMSLSELFRNL